MRKNEESDIYYCNSSRRADGPTAIMVTSVSRTGSAVIEAVVGAILIVAGIWGLRK